MRKPWLFQITLFWMEIEVKINPKSNQGFRLCSPSIVCLANRSTKLPNCLALNKTSGALASFPRTYSSTHINTSSLYPLMYLHLWNCPNKGRLREPWKPQSQPRSRGCRRRCGSGDSDGGCCHRAGSGGGCLSCCAGSGCGSACAGAGGRG